MALTLRNTTAFGLKAVEITSPDGYVAGTVYCVHERLVAQAVPNPVCHSREEPLPRGDDAYDHATGNDSEDDPADVFPFEC